MARTFEEAFAFARDRGWMDDGDRDGFREAFDRNPHMTFTDREIATLALTSASDPTKALDAFPELPGPDEPGDVNVVGLLKRPRHPAPTDVDPEVRSLYERAEERARRDGTDFWTALAEITQNPDVRSKGDAPAQSKLPQDLADQASEESKRVDELGRRVMNHLCVGYIPATELVVRQDEIDVIRLDTGGSDVPWLDLRQLPSPPRPWADDDWERDRRRARRAGAELEREVWQAAADEGRDIVHEQWAAAQADELQRLVENLDRDVENAQLTERTQRIQAIEEELVRRATDRVARGSGAR